jgi:hypothetical protein
MQKRGRPPAAIPTEQVTVRLPRQWLEGFRRHGNGVSAEIYERIYCSLLDEQRDQQFRMFAGKMEKLATDVHHALGARWYEDRKAHLVFIEIVRRMLADLPVPSAEISESPADVKTAADLLYSRYVAEQRDIELSGKPGVRISPSVRYGVSKVPEDEQ